MKFKNGKTISMKTEEVPVGLDDDGNEIKIKMKGVRLGIPAQLDFEIPHAKPPLGDVHRDSKGRPVMGEDGHPKRSPRFDDPKYLSEMAERSQLRDIALIYYCICEGEIDWDGLDPSSYRDKGDMISFFLQVKDRFEKAGILTGPFNDMTHAVVRLSKLEKKEMQQAHDNLGKEKDGVFHPNSPGSPSSQSAST